MKRVKPLTATRHLLAGAGEFVVIDVGARRGATPIWKGLAENGATINFIGFEPEPRECASLNAEVLPYRHRSYPLALGRKQGIRELLVPDFNHAAASFYLPDPTWRGQRFDPKAVSGNVREAIDAPQPELHGSRIPIDVTTLDAFAEEHEIRSFDFLKIDVEGAELDVLQGAETLLKSQPAAAVEVEVMFASFRLAPLFHEISGFMHSLGYELYDLDVYRYSRGVAPSPAAGPWIDHDGQPTAGPTVDGQIVHGDALFVRNPIMMGATPDRARIARAACILDLHGLPDCAEELVRYYA
jgi:FkbM family methyltransferase